MYEIIMAGLGIIGTLFGIYSLILQLRDRYRINPKIQSTFVRTAPNLDYLIQVTLINLGGRVAENCTARIFEDENPLADLSHMPIDSPLGRISPDWPTYSFFTIFPKTSIIVRGYLDSNLRGHRVHIRLYYKGKVRDSSNQFTLPRSQEFSVAVESPAEVAVDLRTEVDEIDRPKPSFPSNRWEFLWFRYTEDKRNPWGDLIAQTSKIEINFDEDWGKGIVNDSGLSNNVCFRASRTIRLDEEGTYTFLIGGDDGIRLYVYNDSLTETLLEINGWNDQPYSQFEKTITLPTGEYKLLLEWYECYNNARASFKLSEYENKKGAVIYNPS